MKEVAIQVRLPEPDKKAFADLCKGKDTTVSREIRIFIREQLKKNSQQSIKF
ncbi:hypothetical protein [Xenorhabdus bovienii]|uniref:hypothetical protein n=1 Tax=Xenorhabdus bovienii TaxID=40576 RepID=UPI0023B20E99|nr:hypothetical protein [Xenorhabdus bovienii]MDE9483976.1 hypothetical protein [Xenorhabdus bovienii]